MATRVVAAAGHLLLTDPFYFRAHGAPAGDPREAIERELSARGLQIRRSQDAVPWVWATYNRHWRLYFNYCLEASREGPRITGSLHRLTAAKQVG